MNPAFAPRIKKQPQLRRQAGFNLTELMIASAIGLVLLAGMATLFVSNTRTQNEIEKANRQIENGRYGVQVLSTDLTNAGFYGEFDPTPLDAPAALPTPCSTQLDDLRAALPLAVQGMDDPDASADLPCLTDRKPGSDVLVLRRTQTCAVGEGNCAAAADGGVFFQASLCHNNSELGSADPLDHFDMDSKLAGLTRHQRDCSEDAGTGTAATVRRYVTHIYYIANNSEEGDGIPTLKRAELGGPDGALAFTVVPLVEGIEELQFEYNMGAGVISAAPATVDDWRRVVAVRMHLLSRNLDKTPLHTDVKTYQLGRKADGSTKTINAFNDQYKRHVFQSQVALRNPAGRLM
jgi:type IV pilus assembly protein PilW